ncbi:MAG: SpoIIE family protein phosphatase [bacterium]|nr:SpoIIE family protein phosphatase [bacterium]MDE0601139.1 SpoIIE family protein phosphatase [bacterium]
MVRPYKILVVDDEPDLEPLMLQRMRRHIRAGRYSFVFARNGLEALDRLNEDGDIDMVLSDINMPQMDGLTLLEQIPKVDPNIRSVIISAYGDMKNIRTAMNRGAFDFVTKPVDFKDLQITIERTLAHMMEWREALSYRDKLVSIQNELEVASRIQQSILPSEFPDDLRYQVYGNMEPARDVGGDFFDIMLLDEGQIGLAIADVSDKGVPAALFMMSCRTLLKGVAIGLTEPGAVLGEVNDLLHEDNETMLFVTVLYAVYNPSTGEFTYASGGHDPPLLIRSDGSVSLLPLTDGIALGVVPELNYKQHKITLSPGDTVVLYTDGVTEAQNTDGSAFEVDGLHQIFAGSSAYLKAREGTDLVFEKVREFMGEASQFDDITCLTLHRDT